jgi:ACR3 family arsenite efflux pump ArsB
MEIDYSPLQPFVNGLLQNLLIVLGVPLIGAIVLKYILIKIRVSDYFANSISSLAFLFFAYKMFMNVIE